MAFNSTVDGLGGDELNQPGEQSSQLWLTGSITSDSQISGANIYGGTSVQSASIVGTEVESTNDVTVGKSIYQGYADSEGVIINNVTAEAIITGGMWVTISGGSAASPTFVAVPLGAGGATGICLATVASGANPQILTRGYYKGMIADASVNVGASFSPGAGAALNTVGAAAAGTTRGTVLMGGGSEAETVVYLW